MLVIGLILVLIALVVVGFMAFGTADLEKVEIDLWVLTANLNPLEIFGLGALSIVVLAVGLLLVFTGMRRQRRKRKEMQELRHKAELADRGAPSREPRPQSAPGQPEPPRQQAPGQARRDPGSAETGDRVVTDGDRRAPGAEGRIDLPMDHRQPRPDGENR